MEVASLVANVCEIFTSLKTI